MYEFVKVAEAKFQEPDGSWMASFEMRVNGETAYQYVRFQIEPTEAQIIEVGTKIVDGCNQEAARFTGEQE